MSIVSKFYGRRRTDNGEKVVLTLHGQPYKPVVVVPIQVPAEVEQEWKMFAEAFGVSLEEWIIGSCQRMTKNVWLSF